MKKTSIIFIALVAAGIGLWVPGASADVGRTDNDAPISGVLPVGPLGTCADTVVNGTLGSGSPDWPSVSGTQTGRLNRNGVGSSCAVPKICNPFDSTPGRAFDAYTFSNVSGNTACVTVTLNVITQTACNVQVNAYTGTYNPASICTNYLADPGLSSGTPPTPVMFSTNVLNGNDFVLSVHTTNPGEIGCQYTLTVSGETCGAETDLGLTKTVSPASVTPGGQAVFTLTVNNLGPGAATNTVVTDVLPAGLTYVSNDCGANFAAPNLTWNVGALANGGSAVCNVTVTVDSAGSFANSASVVSDQTDPVTANNGATATVGGQVNSIEVPALSTAGFALMLLGLGTAALFVLRRRS